MSPLEQIEELVLLKNVCKLHYGKCFLIGKLLEISVGQYKLENIKLPNLKNQHSLPEGTCTIPLLIYDNIGYKLQNRLFYEVYGKVVLINIEKAEKNWTPLTSRDIHDHLHKFSEEIEKGYFIEKIGKTQKVAIKVWKIKKIDRARELIESNLVFISEKSFWDTFLCEYSANFKDHKEVEWSKYWQVQGENLVLTKWKIKYRDYLAESSDEVDEFNESSLNQCLESPDEQHSQSWQDLWYKHHEEIYWEQYNLFDSVFLNYLLNLKESIEINEYLDDQIELESLEDEIRKIEFMGLPISFGNKNKKSNKVKTNVQNLNWLFSKVENETDMKSRETTNNSENGISEVKEMSIVKKKKNRKLCNIPKFLLEEKGMIKYWRKRFSLFSRFDKGIQLDREGWFSVTPEKVAKHLAEKLSCNLIIDGFCGCGGNAIQFAKTCKKVVAIDIDPIKIQMAKHNAAIYNVADKIEFIVADFLQIIDNGRLKADVVFMSPPWGGPNYKEETVYDIDRFLSPVSATELVNKTKTICENIALFLPRNSNLKQVVKLAGIGNRCEIVHSYLDSRLVGITALYGEDIIISNSSNR